MGTWLSHGPFQTRSLGNLHFTYGKVNSMGSKSILGNNAPRESVGKEKNMKANKINKERKTCCGCSWS